MSLLLVTGPATEPLTTQEVKAHLRLDSAAGEVSPGAATCALASPAAPGNVDNGVHRYRVTFITADGGTEGGTVSAAVTVADKTVNGQVALTAIPLGGSAVTSRKVYRTTANTATYLLLTTISNNTATTYTDNVADASLTTAAPTTNTTGDPELNRLIVAARMRVEADIEIALITQTWDKRYDSWPAKFRIPRPPLISVTHVKYLDADGVEQTWAAGNYTVDTPSDDRGRIVVDADATIPSLATSVAANLVTVRFVAGYGAASAVPQSLKQAMLLMIAHWYEHRESVVEGTWAEIPDSAATILSIYNQRAVTF